MFAFKSTHSDGNPNFMSANKIVCFKHIYDCNQGRIQDVTGGGRLDLFGNKKKDLGRKRRVAG